MRGEYLYALRLADGRWCDDYSRATRRLDRRAIYRTKAEAVRRLKMRREFWMEPAELVTLRVEEVSRDE